MFRLAFFLFPLTTFGLSVISHWVETPPVKREAEITQERTRPVLVGEIIYTANLSGIVQAIHRIDGYPLWKVKLDNGVEGALSYGRSKVFVGDQKGNFFALNARDGSVSWKFKVSTEWLSPPCIHRDKVFAVTSSEEVYAFAEATGKELWHYSHRGDEKMTVRGLSGPTAFGTDIYVGFADGSVVSLDLEKGRVNWTKRLRTRERFYDVDMNVYADESGVVASTFDGKTYGLDRLTGNIQWVYPVGSYAGFLVEENRLYFSGLDGNIHALDRSNGVQLWKTPFNGGVGTALARAGEYLVLSTAGDPIQVLNPKDGKSAWNSKLGTGTLAAPSGSADGWFYVLSNYGNLFSFQVMENRTEYKGPQTIAPATAVVRNLADKRYNQ